MPLPWKILDTKYQKYATRLFFRTIPSIGTAWLFEQKCVSLGCCVSIHNMVSESGAARIVLRGSSHVDPTLSGL